MVARKTLFYSLTLSLHILARITPTNFAEITLPSFAGNYSQQFLIANQLKSGSRCTVQSWMSFLHCKLPLCGKPGMTMKFISAWSRFQVQPPKGKMTPGAPCNSNINGVGNLHL
jgi:hypothetical protein